MGQRTQENIVGQRHKKILWAKDTRKYCGPKTQENIVGQRIQENIVIIIINSLFIEGNLLS